MQRKAWAEWQGNLKEGKGMLSTESGALSNNPYSFSMRFESQKGTNPEELIAAAHAGCFTMALSSQLANAGLTAEKLHTEAFVSLDKSGQSWSVTEVRLEVTAKIPGADKAVFEKAANEAKANCPISRLLNAKITMNASLESGARV